MSPSSPFLVLKFLFLAALYSHFARATECDLSQLVQGHEIIYGKTVHYRRFPEGQSGYVQDLNAWFGAKDQVFLGINDPQHYYLVVDNHHYAAQIMRLPEILSPTERRTEYPGLILHFRNLPPKTLARLKEEIRKKPEFITATCTHAVCRMLDEAGLPINDNEGPAIEQSKTLSRILNHGFLTPNGQPAEFDVYLNSPKTLQTLAAEWERQDKILERGLRANFHSQTSQQIVETIRRERGPIDPVVEGIILGVASGEITLDVDFKKTP